MHKLVQFHQKLSDKPWYGCKLTELASSANFSSRA